MSEPQPKSKRPILPLVLAVLIFIAVMGMVYFITTHEEIKSLKQQVAILTNATDKLNTTDTTIINYINKVSEPLRVNVIKYANQTDERLDALESKR